MARHQSTKHAVYRGNRLCLARRRVSQPLCGDSLTRASAAVSPTNALATAGSKRQSLFSARPSIYIGNNHRPAKRHVLTRAGDQYSDSGGARRAIDIERPGIGCRRACVAPGRPPSMRRLAHARMSPSIEWRLFDSGFSYHFLCPVAEIDVLCVSITRRKHVCGVIA